jgi:hypothetical protein
VHLNGLTILWVFGNDNEDRYRYRRAISTACTKSTINQGVRTRMTKKQQMRWAARGAYHLRPVRPTALHGDLRHVFARGYLRMCPETGDDRKARVPPV